MNTTRLLTRLFAAIDSRDPGAFAAFLADDVLFRFANAEPVRGRDAVSAAVVAFFDSIAGLRHDIVETWVRDDALVCHGTVTYRRHDGSELAVPFANVLKGDDAGIREYLIFVDTSRLHAPA